MPGQPVFGWPGTLPNLAARRLAVTLAGGCLAGPVAHERRECSLLQPGGTWPGALGRHGGGVAGEQAGSLALPEGRLPFIPCRFLPRYIAKTGRGLFGDLRS